MFVFDANFRFPENIDVKIATAWKRVGATERVNERVEVFVIWCDGIIG